VLVQIEEYSLFELLQKEDVFGYFIKLINYYGQSPDDQDYMTDSVCRLFRNLTNIRFQGPIHEEITNSILRNYPTKQILFSDLKIKHFGYLDYIIQKKQKNKRNMKLIQTAIKNDPCNYYLQYGLGTEYFQTGDFQKHLKFSNQS
jgi:hypothetical protein